MEEFLLNRRYCRFTKKKTKKRCKMDGDDAANFKVRRLIQDIEKYKEKNKKRRARKGARIKENCITAVVNKGIYKNAVVSHPCIKASISGSTAARLKGDLIALANKSNNFTKKKSVNKIAEVEVNQESELEFIENNEFYHNSNGRKSPKSLILNENESNHHLAELDTVLVENCNLGEIETGTNENNDLYLRKRQILKENQSNVRFFSEEEFGNKVISTAEDVNVTKNEHSKLVFDLVPPSKKDFFDLLSDSPKKKNSSPFKLHNNPLGVSQNQEDILSRTQQRTFEISPPNIGNVESCVMPSLPKDYFFKFLPQNSVFPNHNKLFREYKGGQEDYTSSNFNLLSHNYVTSPPKFKRMYSKSLYSSNQVKSPKGFINEGVFKSPLEDISSNSSNCRQEVTTKLGLREEILLMNSKKFPDNFDTYKNLSGKHGDVYMNCKNKFMKENLNKYLMEERHKDQFDQRKGRRSVLNQHKSTIFRSNRHFKSHLKFSPHKYC